jgi:hypothetical protein
MQQRERACADLGVHRLQRGDEIGPEERGFVVALIKCDPCRGVLRETQLAGTRDSFGAPLDLEFAKDLAVVSFHRVQGEE